MLSIHTIKTKINQKLSPLCGNLKLKRIKADVPRDTDNYIFNIIIDISQLTNLGGFTGSHYFPLIEEMPKLRNISLIQIQNDYHTYIIFDKFFNTLKKETKDTIRKLTLEYYSLRKDYDFDYFKKEFPNLKQLITLCNRKCFDEERLRIDKIVYLCSNVINESALEFVAFLLKNNLKEKVKGKKCYTIKCKEHVILVVRLLNYLHEQGEEELLNSIDTFDVMEHNGYKIEGLILPPINQINKLRVNFKTPI